MPSVRMSFSLDAVNDHELLQRLEKLQRGQASGEIRTALYEHFGIQVTLQDVVDRLDRIEARLDGLHVESSVGGRTEENAPTTTTKLELENRLDKALGRFRRENEG